MDPKEITVTLEEMDQKILRRLQEYLRDDLESRAADGQISETEKQFFKATEQDTIRAAMRYMYSNLIGK